MVFRRSASWMCALDDRILEHIEEESWSSPTVMESRPEFRASRARFRERCNWLAYAGLIAPLYDGCSMYELTGEGQQYLCGDLDAEYLPRP
jgi:hypothetical protein